MVKRFHWRVSEHEVDFLAFFFVREYGEGSTPAVPVVGGGGCLHLLDPFPRLGDHMAHFAEQSRTQLGARAPGPDE